MPLELLTLGWAGLLVIVQLLLAAGPRANAYGLGWAMGPRDDKPDVALPERAHRAERAYRNLIETFPLFVAGTLGVVLADATSWLSAAAVQLYFWARVAYVPAYLFHVPALRSTLWSIAMLGIAILLGILAVGPLFGPAETAAG